MELKKDPLRPEKIVLYQTKHPRISYLTPKNFPLGMEISFLHNQGGENAPFPHVL